MAKHKYRDYLKAVPLFRDLNSRDLDAIASVVTDMRVEAGRGLMRQGDHAHEMFIVTSGEVAGTRAGKHVAEIGPGSVAGEMAGLARSSGASTVAGKTGVGVRRIEGRSLQGRF